MFESCLSFDIESSFNRFPDDDFNAELVDESLLLNSISLLKFGQLSSISVDSWDEYDGIGCSGCSIWGSLLYITLDSLVGLVDEGGGLDVGCLAGAKTETGIVRRWPVGERRRFSSERLVNLKAEGYNISCSNRFNYTNLVKSEPEVFESFLSRFADAGIGSLVRECVVWTADADADVWIWLFVVGYRWTGIAVRGLLSKIFGW